MAKNDQLIAAIRFLELEGYVFDPEPNSKGYLRAKCTCGGRHSGWLHKTPSNPHHHKEKAAHLVRLCQQYREENG